LAKFPQESTGGDAAVVNSLIKKLRPHDSSYGSSSERPSSFAARPLPRARPIKAPMSSAAVWSCVGLGVLLGAALPQWPYAKACGVWLVLYMAAVEIVVVAGIWGARVSWKSRLGFAHTIAVCTIMWGLALTAQEVLPRVGYAKVRLAWRCHDGHAAFPSADRLAALKPSAEASAVR
jgi:VIT1/CCC1 family predicted Fe2+/Mn2+ transporter